MDNNVDTTTEIGYNSNQNDENVIIVKMEEQSAINDTSCEHKYLVADPDDTIGDAIYYGCANPKCGRGYYGRTK